MRKTIPALIICFIIGLVATTSMPAAEHASAKSSENQTAYKRKNRRQIEIPAKFLTLKLKERDPSLDISVESVLQRLKEKQELVLIDVRNKQEFDKIRIPGSLNMPLSTIKTKSFLKDKNLVLVDTGYSYSKLEQECRRLKDAGFASVHIMNGGLSCWREEGGTLEGDVFMQKELNKVSPGGFFAERNYKNWLVIDVAMTRETEAEELIPQGVHIPYTNNAKWFVAKLKATIAKRKKGSFLPVLLFNEYGQQYEKIEELVQEAGIRNVFYLKGGLVGYKVFLQKQALIWQSKGNLGHTAKKCNSCS